MRQFIFWLTFFSFTVIGCSSNNDPVAPSCPKTANCGCSGKNKANCPNDPCCKWVVGDGCNCK